MPEHPVANLQSSAGRGKEALKAAHPRKPLQALHPKCTPTLIQPEIRVILPISENTDAPSNKAAIPDDK